MDSSFLVPQISVKFRWWSPPTSVPLAPGLGKICDFCTVFKI